MTGTGTAEDPYIVDTIEDFRTAIATSCDYVKLDTDLDCSDMDYWTGVAIQAVTIDLCGHTIKNINITPIVADKNYLFSCSITKSTIKNGTFQSIYGTNVECIYKNTYRASSYTYAYFIDVKFSGILTLSNTNNIFENYGGSSTWSSYPGSLYFTRCSINLKITNNVKYSVFFTRTDERAKIVHDSCNYKFDFTSEHDYPLNGVFQNSKLTGNINLTSSNTSYIFYKLNSCVIAVSLSSVAKVCMTYVACAGLTVVDVDLMTGCSEYGNTDDTNIKYLTTAQMKSAEYLNSIGFPVSEV